MKNSGRKCANSTALRQVSLLLALLVLLTPLLSIAAPLSAATQPVESAIRASQPPCHSPTGAQLDPVGAIRVDADCPHCSGDAPASQCHCWGDTLPTGLASGMLCRPAVIATAEVMTRIVTDALPDCPPENLFRPPISSHI
jgi:hypothetical protein